MPPKGRAVRCSDNHDATAAPFEVRGEKKIVSLMYARQVSDIAHTCKLPTVYVVDSDSRVRESLAALIASMGWHPITASSAEEFLAAPRTSQPHCLITELQLPGISGLELQSLVGSPATPLIFLSGCTDVQSSVRAMKAGALEYLLKPYAGDVLLDTVGEAIERSRAAMRHEAEIQTLKQLHESLTLREREVMVLVVLGLLNKQVGAELNISEFTVKAHRGRVMRKMKAMSLPSLVLMADRLGVRQTTH
jgi:FixJ family two-component response regulator